MRPMSLTLKPRVPDAAAVAALGPGQIAQLLQSQAAQIEELKRQIEWFKRQIFGNKSERFVAAVDAQQMHLGQLLGDLAPPGFVVQTNAAGTSPRGLLICT